MDGSSAVLAEREAIVRMDQFKERELATV